MDGVKTKTRIYGQKARAKMQALGYTIVAVRVHVDDIVALSQEAEAQGMSMQEYCHLKLTGKAQGRMPSKRKLDLEIAKEIRRDLAAGVGMQALADKHKVSRTMIYFIRKNKAYKEV